MPADLSFGTAVLCARPARPAMPARASFERSHLRTWPACSWLVPSLSFRCRRPRSLACHARCRACVDARDANSAAHSPEATEGEGQQYTTTTTSHTPRWPAPSAPHGPAQPPFASAIASSASNQVAPSSSANAAAAPRQRPGRLADLHAQPCPPLPTRLVLGSIS